MSYVRERELNLNTHLLTGPINGRKFYNFFETQSGLDTKRSIITQCAYITAAAKLQHIEGEWRIYA